MKKENYERILAFLRRESGLVLGPEKQYLLDARLMPLAEQFGIRDLDSLALALATNRKLGEHVVDAMTTNETYFFRDPHIFTMIFQEIFPALIESRSDKKKLRIWSAACSSGQEPYSLLMGLDRDHPVLKDWQIEIVATDLSESILSKARAGTYNHFEIQRGLPAPLLVKYFDQQERSFQAKPELRARVDFRPLNLKSSFRGLGMFDLILCRNVLIYFDPESKSDILNRLGSQLAPDGFLLLGSSEATIGLQTSLQKQKLDGGLVLRPESASVPQ